MEKRPLPSEGGGSSTGGSVAFFDDQLDESGDYKLNQIVLMANSGSVTGYTLEGEPEAVNGTLDGTYIFTAVMSFGENKDVTMTGRYTTELEPGQIQLGSVYMTGNDTLIAQYLADNSHPTITSLTVAKQ